MSLIGYLYSFLKSFITNHPTNNLIFALKKTFVETRLFYAVPYCGYPYIVFHKKLDDQRKSDVTPTNTRESWFQLMCNNMFICL